MARSAVDGQSPRALLELLRRSVLGRIDNRVLLATVDLGTFPLSAVDADPALLEKLAQTLMVYRKGAGGFDVKVTTDVDGLDIRAERGPLGDRWQVTLTLKRESLKPGAIKGSILIETNDPEFSRLRVPVSGLVIAKV